MSDELNLEGLTHLHTEATGQTWVDCPLCGNPMSYEGARAYLDNEAELDALRARIAELEAELVSTRRLWDKEADVLRRQKDELLMWRGRVPWEDISALMKSIHPGRLDCDWTLLESYVRVDAWREQYRPPAREEQDE